MRDLRVPRTELGLLVGAALGAAGALMQGATRNALAEPGILGINAGAAFAVVIAISFLGVRSVTAYAAFALVGAGACAVIVLALGGAGRGASAVNLALAGAVMATLLISLTSAVLVFDAQTLDQFRFWIVGSIAGRDAGVALAVLPVIAVGPRDRARRRARAQRARARATTSRARSASASDARAARPASVSCCSRAARWPPPARSRSSGSPCRTSRRAFAGPDYRWMIPYSILLGAVLLLVADVIGRVVARPGRPERRDRDGAARRPVLHLAHPPAAARRAMSGARTPRPARRRRSRPRSLAATLAGASS